MLDRLKTNAPNPLDSHIEDILTKMKMVEDDSEEYQKLMTSLERLHKLRREQKPERVSRDTVAIVAGNLAGILLIIAYEQKHVIVSKGFGMLIRPKNSN